MAGYLQSIFFNIGEVKHNSSSPELETDPLVNQQQSETIRGVPDSFFKHFANQVPSLRVAAVAVSSLPPTLYSRKFLKFFCCSCAVAAVLGGRNV